MFTYEDQEIEIATSQSMAADFTSKVHEIRAFDCGSVQYTWTGANTTTAKVIPQLSNDGVNFCDYIGENDANRIDDVAGCGVYEIQKICLKYFRIRFVANTNTAGTLTVRSYVKRPRIQP